MNADKHFCVRASIRNVQGFNCHKEGLWKRNNNVFHEKIPQQNVFELKETPKFHILLIIIALPLKEISRTMWWAGCAWVSSKF